MKKLIQSIIAFGILSVGMVSCFKDTDEFFPYPPSNDNIETFFTAVKTAPEVYNLDLDNAKLAVTNDNTFIQIVGNCVNAAGDAVSGIIQVEVIEILKKGDMIRFRTPTISNAALIGSAGEFRVRLLKDGQEVFLAAGAKLNMRIPQTNQGTAAQMQTFYGVRPATNDNINWLPTDSTANIVTWEDTSNVFVGFDLFSDSLNWINCDYFVNASPLTSLCAELPDSFSNANTAVFCVFTDINAVVILQSNSQNMQWCVNNMPEGANVKLVSISIIDDQYYLGTFTSPIVPNFIVPMSPEPKTLAEIQAYLDGL